MEQSQPVRLHHLDHSSLCSRLTGDFLLVSAEVRSYAAASLVNSGETQGRRRCCRGGVPVKSGDGPAPVSSNPSSQETALMQLRQIQ